MRIVNLVRSPIPKMLLAIFLTSAAGVGLIALHRSAQSLIENSNAENDYNNSINSAPLATLDDVIINARQGGRSVGQFQADSLAIGRDTRSMTINNASGSVPIMGQAKSKLQFRCGQAQYWNGIMGPQTGILELSRGLTADFASDLGPVHISADGMRWDGRSQMANVIGSIKAAVGSLGNADCQTMYLDLRNKAIVFGAVQILISGAVLQTPVQAGAASASPSQSDEQIKFYAPQGGRDDEQRKMLHISGPVTVTQGEVRLTTVGVDFDHVSRDAKALSPVAITDDSNSLKGDSGDVNFTTHIATINGHVDIYAVPKDKTTKKSDEIDTEARQPTHMHCDHLVYNYRTKLADADGNLVVLQTSRTVTAKTAHYDTVAQIIKLDGSVDAKSNDGKHLTAPNATVSVNPDDEWIEIKGPVTYQFPVSDVDNPLPPAARSKSAKPTAKPAATASPTPTPQANPTP